MGPLRPVPSLAGRPSRGGRAGIVDNGGMVTSDFPPGAQRTAQLSFSDQAA